MEVQSTDGITIASVKQMLLPRGSSLRPRGRAGQIFQGISDGALARVWTSLSYTFCDIGFSSLFRELHARKLALKRDHFERNGSLKDGNGVKGEFFAHH